MHANKLEIFSLKKLYDKIKFYIVFKLWNLFDNLNFPLLMSMDFFPGELRNLKSLNYRLQKVWSDSLLSADMIP